MDYKTRITQEKKEKELGHFFYRTMKPILATVVIFKLIPKKTYQGRNGQGNLDYAIECRSTGRILCIIEVKKDFMKGFAQDGSVQMESSLSGHKCEVNEIESGGDVDKLLLMHLNGILWNVLDLEESHCLVVVCDDADMVKKHILWLSEEAQKSGDIRICFKFKENV